MSAIIASMRYLSVMGKQLTCVPVLRKDGDYKNALMKRLCFYLLQCNGME